MAGAAPVDPQGFRLVTKTLHRINILCYIRQPSSIIQACKASILSEKLLAEQTTVLDRSIAEYPAALAANEQAEEATGAAPSAPSSQHTRRKSWRRCASCGRPPKPMW
jgi:hypothetical protein